MTDDPLKAFTRDAINLYAGHALDAGLYSTLGIPKRGFAQSGPRSPRIRCAVCDKLVDSVTVEQSGFGHVRTMIARCHGAEDRMTVTAEEMQNWTPAEVAFWRAVDRGEVEGVAFAQPGIEHR